ncbi:hypothetical protein [Pseudoalteromonas denitrificans]|uniref:Uncharacterized protein n=1 Tax=Pseudoalteromonas denitrificans DSM 6059 TaxID=1123010 RepID=A0A1I1FDY7_9GAMM|nr:hypothetical protein [Pseudoalteromonas denitrificans]SFB97494.1 hypothetical protein SAMN02745724_00596 [Pseudoalteromonas denitrificans DSM 6059]
MKDKKNLFFKLSFIIFFSMLLIYIVFILSFSQAISVLHQDLFSSSLEQIKIEDAKETNNTLLSVLFLNNLVLDKNDNTYFVIKVENSRYFVMSIKNILSKIILLINLPLLLLISSLFLLPIYFNFKKKNSTIKL